MNFYQQPNTLDVLIIGGGPIGIEAAIRARRRTDNVCLLEKHSVGHHFLQWHGVKLFTRFEMNRSSVAVDWANDHQLDIPDGGRYMTGREYVREWLRPLVDESLLSEIIYENAEVIGITRAGLLKGDRIGDERRSETPFLIKLNKGGETKLIDANTVIDASGTFGQPNPVGQGGVPAPGERELSQFIHFNFPEDYQLTQWSDEGIFLVGSGYSAATNLLRLHDQWAGDDTEGDLHWLVRSEEGPPISPVENDPLEERSELTRQANACAERSSVNLIRGQQIEQIKRGNEANLSVQCTDGSRLQADRILGNTGYRPDRSLYRELQFHECYGTEGPIDLAAQLLAQDGADCLEIDSGGVKHLKNPEPNFYVVGSKSYGRNSQFLLENGFQQLDDLFDSLITDETDGGMMTTS